MKKHIAEDLPTRSHPQAQLSSQNKKPESRDSGKDSGRDDDRGGEKTPEQKIRQAVYDIRYRARRENIPLRSAYSQFMQNSSMGEAEKSEVRKKLFGGSGGMQAEDFGMDIKESASSSMAKALYKVFVEKKNEVVDIDEIKIRLEEEANQTSESKKYKVRVTDRESGVTYVRYATREKISQLRARGLEVEMTEYGDPYEGERTKGEKTAEVLGKRAKKDYDGDGKVENGAKEHAGAVHNAIQRRKGGKPDGKDTSSVKEEFIGEVSKMSNLSQTDASEYLNQDSNNVQLDILPANKKNKITVNPNNTVLAHTELSGEVISETGYSKFLGMLQEKKMTKAAKTKEKKLKAKYDPSGMKASMQDQYGKERGKKVYFASIRKQAMKEESECGSENNKKEIDKRSLPTTKSLIASKLQSMGVKNPIVMAASYEPEGEVIDERTRQRKEEGKPRRKPDPALMIVRGQNETGFMTRSGGTVAQHKERRGVKKDRTGPVEPQRPAVTPADKVKERRRRSQAAANDDMMHSRFD